MENKDGCLKGKRKISRNKTGKRKTNKRKIGRVKQVGKKCD